MSPPFARHGMHAAQPSSSSPPCVPTVSYLPAIFRASASQSLRGSGSMPAKSSWARAVIACWIVAWRMAPGILRLQRRSTARCWRRRASLSDFVATRVFAFNEFLRLVLTALEPPVPGRPLAVASSSPHASTGGTRRFVFRMRFCSLHRTARPHGFGATGTQGMPTCGWLMVSSTTATRVSASVRRPRPQRTLLNRHHRVVSAACAQIQAMEPAGPHRLFLASSSGCHPPLHQRHSRSKRRIEVCGARLRSGMQACLLRS